MVAEEVSLGILSNWDATVFVSRTRDSTSQDLLVRPWMPHSK